MNKNHVKQENALSKYLKSDNHPPINYPYKKSNNPDSKLSKQKQKESLVIEIKQNTFTVDSETKINSGNISDFNENANVGKDQKLKALQNMPIK